MAASLNQPYALLQAGGRAFVSGAAAASVVRTSILLVEEHGAISELISAFLEQHVADMQILGTVQALDEATTLCEEILPDVIVFEPLMPGFIPLEMVKQLIELCPRAKLLAFTRSDAPGLVAEMRAAGVRGVVTRRRPLSEFVAALRAVAGGETFFDEQLVPSENAPHFPRLTGREKMVVRLVSEGLSTKEIAARMAVSSKTVDKFRQKAMNKLDLHDAVRVTRYAIRNGIATI